MKIDRIQAPAEGKVQGTADWLEAQPRVEVSAAASPTTATAARQIVAVKLLARPYPLPVTLSPDKGKVAKINRRRQSLSVAYADDRSSERNPLACKFEFR